MNHSRSLCLTLSLLLATTPLLADHHTEAERAEREAVAEARRAEVEQRREALVERRREAERRREEVLEREAEMSALAEELAKNSLELVELSRSLESLSPEIQERIRRSLVIADRPLIGVNIASPEVTEDGVAGVAVVAVTPGGPADAAGVRSGDVIVRIGDTALAAPDYGRAEAWLLGALEQSAADEPVALTLERDGEVVTTEVTPTAGLRYRFGGDAATVWADGANSFAFSFDPMLSGAQRAWDGLELAEVTPGLGRYFGTESGLLVLSVPEDSGIALAEGDVILRIGNRTPTSVGHAMRILRSYDAGETLQLAVMREQRERALSVTIP